MKTLRKTTPLLFDNSGETMVEVLVAFTVLLIMLVVFFQGIAWASKTEINASNSRSAADKAMKDLQHDLASGEARAADETIPVGSGEVKVYTYTYTYNGQIYTYTVYKPG